MAKIIFRNNPDVVDMFVFTICKYNIISNSTFSNWGAWLNDIDNKVVFAPKFNLGWHKRAWIPYSSEARPSAWNYVDVLELLGKNE